MKEVTKFLELPVPTSQLLIWVFAPHRITEKGLVSREYAITGHQELADAFAELGIKWKWQPITFENMYAVVEEVAASSNEYTPIVLNYCDGEEMPDYPGTCVIELLEEKGIIFTGAGSAFSRLCSSKILEKRAFVEAGVPTSPYEVIFDINQVQGFDINQVQGICDRLGTPLIVKPAMSVGSEGISLQSVVSNDEQLMAQVQALLRGQLETHFPPGSIFVERFINGSEFSVLVVGSANQPNSLKIYPPVERVFHPHLPETERFLSFERYWGTEKSSSEAFCRFQLVDPDLLSRLYELTKRAYCAVDGNGYGRVDIRMDKASGELFVLEVNANCYVSSLPQYEFSNQHTTTVGTILHLSSISFTQLMLQIIAEAFARHSTKAQLRTV
jgi:D-alanine-D-alanine ligase